HQGDKAAAEPLDFPRHGGPGLLTLRPVGSSLFCRCHPGRLPLAGQTRRTRYFAGRATAPSKNYLTLLLVARPRQKVKERVRDQDRSAVRTELHCLQPDLGTIGLQLHSARRSLAAWVAIPFRREVLEREPLP